MNIRPLALALAFATAVPAQENTAAQELPVLVEGHVMGPEAARRALLATNLGTMLATDESETLRGRFWGILTYGVGQEVAGKLESWSGTLRFRTTAHGDRPDRTVTIVQLEGDEPEQFLKPISAVIDRGGLPRERLELAGGTRDRIGLGGNMECVLPFTHEGRVVMAFTHRTGAGDLDAALRAALVAPVDPKSRRDIVSVTANLQAVMDAALQPLNGMMGPLLQPTALDTLHLAIRPAGPHLMFETAIQFTRDDKRGFWSGFFPATGELTPMIHRIPEGAPNWKAGHMDLAGLTKTVFDFLATLGFAPDGDPYQAMQKEIGFHILDDFLNHLEGDALVLASNGQARDFPEGLLRGSCFAFRIRDRADFHQTWKQFGEQFADHMGGDAKAEPWQDGKATIYVGSDNWLHSTHYCVHEDLFLVAFGDDGRKLLEQLLATPAPEGAEGLPKALSRMARYAAPGINGAARLDVSTGLATYLLPILEVIHQADALPMEPDDLGRSLDKAMPLLKPHNLDVLHSFTSYSDKRWTLRLLW